MYAKRLPLLEAMQSKFLQIVSDVPLYIPKVLLKIKARMISLEATAQLNRINLCLKLNLNLFNRYLPLRLGKSSRQKTVFQCVILSGPVTSWISKS